MSAEARLGISLRVTGLSDEYEVDEAITITGTPAEIFQGHAVIGTTVASLDLGTIAPADVLGILIVAVVGSVGVLVNDVGTGSPSTTAGNILLGTGEFTYLNLAGGLTEDYTIRIKGSVATSAIKYFVIGG
ncbi:MAG: hypothetical protein WC451_03230 [Patescibacteria group bacterium]|jgi:hypothetical protein